MASATLKSIKCIAGGKLVWTTSRLFTDGLDSADNNFRIVPSKREGYLLLAFRHPDPEGKGRFWTLAFATIEEAMAHAETF